MFSLCSRKYSFLLHKISLKRKTAQHRFLKSFCDKHNFILRQAPLKRIPQEEQKRKEKKEKKGGGGGRTKNT